ncbi:Dam family site-specific DNA-(adenine-N6)-methyltransferase [Catonella massiliensis]|jgi:DNA adenine methylase|uniref:Site-specific DNA-methyltransferase (adenine-specific) n=1 Tax=Catonella massiliensis TaxID=2799636 RepID=A0ABS1J2R3_9FIRM|nr:Dam family site-specific DNA-(adenine-N6)-methyltransferase [Catonella massiliensis]MBK5898436.1 Dam family site-specific DNA-(adenine-N6)-methyltransferase [Catonella massiliensis]
MNYSATQLAKKLDISRSYLYYLKDNGVIEVEVNNNGRTVWNEEVYCKLKEYIKKNRTDNSTKAEEIVREYKITKINNRRYLGNKYKLLPFIKRVVENECKNINTVADIFAGTGAVASAFTDKKLITNDIMYSNYICHVAWFSNEKYSEDRIINLITGYNNLHVAEDNYMSNNFSNTYFSLDDCRKIGYIRQDIEDKYNADEINGRERALLITSLLYAMDKIANTCGHYDAYRQGIRFEKHLELYVPEPESDLNENNVCYNMDTNKLVPEIEADLVYIDPPYNSRQYCDAYHLLENVARWNKPKVFGVAKKMDRTDLKSDYCTTKATASFEDLINSIHAKYILLSYNNMANKGNDRSNAKMSDDDIMRILRKKGEVKIFAEDYKAFSTGKSDIKTNQERLFLCICSNEEKEVIPSALNYTGGKYKLLSQILPLFPKDIDKMVDLFCGGCNVGINVECNKVLFNDNNKYLVGLLDIFRKLPKTEIIKWVYSAIDKYGLSLVSENGYDFYNSESSKGLGDYNKLGYNKLREDFNKKSEKDDEYYLMLYLLIVYSFNNQLRFNRKEEFNLPVGKRDFNSKMQGKLEAFIDRIKSSDYRFTIDDFRNVSIEGYTDRSFFYADPPYLITCATYNEQSGWTEQDESDLLRYLEELDKKGIRFALSNVLESKGKRNTILCEWINKNEKYRVIPLNYDYSNSNYHTKKDGVTKEVLIVNY